MYSILRKVQKAPFHSFRVWHSPKTTLLDADFEKKKPSFFLPNCIQYILTFPTQPYFWNISFLNYFISILFRILVRSFMLLFVAYSSYHTSFLFHIIFLLLLRRRWSLNYFSSHATFGATIWSLEKRFSYHVLTLFLRDIQAIPNNLAENLAYEFFYENGLSILSSTINL